MKMILYNENDIKNLVDIFVEVVDPDRVILFGSYAYGVPNENSDLDFCLVINNRTLSIEDETVFATKIYSREKQLNISTSYDMLFGTDEDLISCSGNGGAAKDIIRKGVVLYERGIQ
jgi:predicted nucleotidyltransferase